MRGSCIGISPPPSAALSGPPLARGTLTAESAAEPEAPPAPSFVVLLKTLPFSVFTQPGTRAWHKTRTSLPPPLQENKQVRRVSPSPCSTRAAISCVRGRARRKPYFPGGQVAEGWLRPATRARLESDSSRRFANGIRTQSLRKDKRKSPAAGAAGLELAEERPPGKLVG
jgi:hypothetical protein